MIGGRVVGNIPRDWPREKWYHGTDTSADWDGEGYRISQTKSSPWTYQYGSYVENVSDGFDPNGQAGVNHDYLERVHAKYVRDDCIEVEGSGYSPHSVTVKDSLFDGCFNFVSMRPTGTSHADSGTAEGTLTVEDSLVYVQPQPLSAKDCSTHPERCVDGKGNHAFFKWSSSAVENVVVRNTVLRMDQPATASTRAMRFPPGTYENVTLVWTWPEPYTDFADLPEGVTVTNDVGVWERAKDNWLAGAPGGSSGTGGDGAQATNEAPVVDAGPDQTVSGGAATLNGRATDDGLPAGGGLTVRWSTVSGPGTPVIDDPSSARTRVSFPAAGTYVLRLTGSDGEATASDDVTVVVQGDSTTHKVVSRVSARADDAEEALHNHRVDLSSSDLELGYDGSKQQFTGMRFRDVQIPAGATVTNAYVQFTSRATGGSSSDVWARAQRSNDAPAFSSSSGDITSRPLTAASVSWTPSRWSSANTAGSAQRTPDLSAIVQEVIDGPGWDGDGSLALVVAGSGTRNAWSYDGSSAKAPQLVIEYR
ncbi:MAG TPA: hypothetical protein VFX41_02425 [Actinomycetales bacterium]|nr:hypothetical protein [Actinomycetales bacterium]